MILVTGATGNLGRAIVQRLATLVDPAQIRATCRDPGKADLPGVDVHRADFNDAEGLTAAFRGASTVLLVSSNAAATGGDPIAQHRTAIEAARRAGVSHLLYTSHMGASATSQFPPMRDHHATERMLRDSGLRWTALRNGFYASAALFRFRGLPSELVLPADGPVSWTTHADLAEGAARILAGQASWDGPTPPLTAASAWDFEALARFATDILGRPIQRTLESEATMRTRMQGQGVPPRVVDIVAGMFRASHQGEFAATDPTLSSLLGRPTVEMPQFLAESLPSLRVS